MGKIKLQITPKKMVDDAMVVWPERTPDVGIVLDPLTIELKKESIKTIYAFNVLGMHGYKKAQTILENLFNILEQEGELYIIENNADDIARGYIGADISLHEFNVFFKYALFNMPEVVRLLDKVGFPEKRQKAWSDGIKFKKEKYQIIISGKKPITK